MFNSIFEFCFACPFSLFVSISIQKKKRSELFLTFWYSKFFTEKEETKEMQMEENKMKMVAWAHFIHFHSDHCDYLFKLPHSSIKCKIKLATVIYIFCLFVLCIHECHVKTHVFFHLDCLSLFYFDRVFCLFVFHFIFFLFLYFLVFSFI